MAQTAKKKTLKVLDRYDNLPVLTELGRSKEEWTDDQVLIKTSLSLKVTSEKETAELVSNLIKGLTVGMSEKVAYSVLLLTWNMRSETEPSKRIFPSRLPSPVTGDIALLSGVESTPAGKEMIIEAPKESPDIEEYNRAGCFYAASLLKLFTKDHTSWIKAQSHISDSYRKFTDRDFPFRDLPVWEISVAALHRLFHTKLIFKHTLGIILYSLKVLEEGRGMTMMLFEQHLSFTGLHIVGLFCRACSGLKIKPKDLMRALHTDSFEQVLDQLSVVIRDYMGSEAEGRSRETYKYARLYDPLMFSLLQTKNCSDIVCILGHLGKLCGNAGIGNVLEIAAVSQISEDAKELYGKVAKNIFVHFKIDSPAEANEMYIVE